MVATLFSCVSVVLPLALYSWSCCQKMDIKILGMISRWKFSCHVYRLVITLTISTKYSFQSLGTSTCLHAASANSYEHLLKISLEHFESWIRRYDSKYLQDKTLCDFFVELYWSSSWTMLAAFFEKCDIASLLQILMCGASLLTDHLQLISKTLPRRLELTNQKTLQLVQRKPGWCQAQR